MKTPKDLHKELAKRKFKKPNIFGYFIYIIVGKTHLLGAKYHPHYEIKDKIGKGPAFIIWNHQSRRDHVFVAEAAWPRRINIVCEYNEFFRSHLHFALRANQILPKKPFTTDLLGLKAMSQIIKQGGIVAFSPEGTSSIYGNNQPVVAGTGRFLKHFKVPVYFDYIRGSYLTNNKISEQDRPGKVFLTQQLLFSPEDLERLSGEEIEQKINEVFRHNDYEWNKEHRILYKSKGQICTNLEDICYRCPRCGKELSMVASGNDIHCESCGNGATMNDYYDFLPYDEKCVIPEDPTEWMLWERKEIIQDIRKDPEFSFTEHGWIGDLPKDHWLEKKATGERCGEGDLIFDHQGIHYRGTKRGEAFSFDLSYAECATLQFCVDLTFVSFYVKGDYYEFHPDHRTGAKMHMLCEEMHRLHVNEWKNFPWFQDLYPENE